MFTFDDREPAGVPPGGHDVSMQSKGVSRRRLYKYAIYRGYRSPPSKMARKHANYRTYGSRGDRGAQSHRVTTKKRESIGLLLKTNIVPRLEDSLGISILTRS
jgi:hypothetical protein